MLTDLKSATRYLCSLQASTRKGFGSSASLIVWTEPDGWFLSSIVYCWSLMLVYDNLYFVSWSHLCVILVLFLMPAMLNPSRNDNSR